MLRFEPWKIALVAIVTVLGVFFAWPNLLARDTAESLPSWLPSTQINLGLDLQGGSHLLLLCEIDAVIDERLETVVDEIRLRLRERRIGYTGLGASGGQVSFQLRDTADEEDARDALNEVDAGTVITVADSGQVSVSYTDEELERRKRELVAQTIEIVRIRLDETGTREPTIQRQGDDRILVQVPGVEDPEYLKRILGETAKMTFHLVDENTPVEDALSGNIPPGSMLLYEKVEDPNTGQESEGLPVLVRKRVGVSGENLVDAQATFQENQPVVSIRFDSQGARKFGTLTAENVGRRFAIVLDDEVISAPVIREPIPGGNGIISGRFTAQTAGDLALLLRAGALPAPLTILEERTVGPSLGADSIAAGKIASVIGLVLVIAYMIVSYGLFGIAATVALVTNMALIVALLSTLQATLTLPGIAGIVLTIGMAVDANVLIFERIREEVLNGRSPFSAVDIGFQQAFRTIVDANVTTLIAAVLLYQFGSGPVRGFAVTLAIGVLTSMFTAIMVTRLLIVLWLQRTRPKALPI